MNYILNLKSLQLLTLALACFALVPRAQAVIPPPDGGYPGGNTAEGDNALFSLTSGLSNTAIGYASLHDNTAGYNNTATGLQALDKNTTGHNNMANGASALDRNTTGNLNTANGAAALNRNTTGNSNTADGAAALFENTTGRNNTATGNQALNNNTTGNFNIALGSGAGSGLTTGHFNIDIGNEGVAGEQSTIRIGSTSQTRTFVAGISRVGVTGAAVVVNAGGQLGTTTSSKRFKDEVKPMDKASEAILALKPVTFHYKKEIDPEAKSQFGLIAEEVAKVNPALVLPDREGKPYTVRYDAVNAMLLNEFLKEHRKNEEQEKTIAELKSGMTALAATVKEQASQIQKVSAQLQASKPAPQVVGNNR
jgi:hypothetical protein